MSLDGLGQAVVQEELSRAGVVLNRSGNGFTYAGPALLAVGTPEQQQHLPGILSGEDLWCRLFSEPGAGSDLASVSCRAVQDGDDWLINGQKLWAPLAREATLGLLLTRTGDGEPGTSLTMFVCPMTTTGVTVRPLRDSTGGMMLNEVFLDGVRLPGSSVLGSVGAGLALTLPSTPPAVVYTTGYRWGYGPGILELVALAERTGASERAQHDIIDLFIESAVVGMLALRTALCAEVPAHVTTVHRQRLEGHGMSLANFAARMAVSRTGAFSQDEDDAAQWLQAFNMSPGLSIASGTPEVAKDRLAAQILRTG